MIYKLLIILLFSGINILLAKYDWWRIKQHWGIKHGINGAIYTLMTVGVYFLFKDLFLVGALLFDRLLFFNIALSKYRKLSWDYIPVEPKAWSDIVAKWIFGNNGKLMYSIYTILFILLIILNNGL